MNRDYILGLSVGEELNNLVTHEIMGYENNWSESISAAWEVVEKICKNDDVKFSVERNYSFKSMWVAGFNYNRGSYAGHTAPTAAEAICKAALLAVLEEQSNDL